MEVKKGERTYILAETTNGWNVKTDISKVGILYSIPKEICKTIDDVKRYINENDIF